MKRLTMTVAAIALTAGTAAYAQDATGDDKTLMQGDPAAEQPLEQAESNLESAGEEIGQAAENTGEAIRNGAEQAGDAIENAANEAGETLQDAADSVNDTMESAANAVDGALFPNDADGIIRASDLTGGTIYVEPEPEEVAAGGDMSGGTADPMAGDPMASDSAMADDAAGGSTEMPADVAAGEPSMGGESMTPEDPAAQLASSHDNAGKVEDLVFDVNGQVEGIIASVGGFLDIGDKHVQLSLDELRMVPTEDGGYAVVANYTKSELMELPDVEEQVMN